MDSDYFGAVLHLISAHPSTGLVNRMEVHNAENQSSGSVSDIYKTDIFLEVTDEVHAVFLADKRADAAYERQMYRYKAYYSLDHDNGIENAVINRPLTPEEILEDKQRREQLYAAVMALPDKQAKRIYARFYLA